MRNKLFGILLIVIGGTLFVIPIGLVLAQSIMDNPGLFERTLRIVAPILGVVLAIWFGATLVIVGCKFWGESKTKQILSIVILFLSMAIYAPSEVKAQRKDEMWVEVNGERNTLVSAHSTNCFWGDNAPAQINRSGMCGRSPTTRNDFMIYSHASWCDAPGPGSMCHYGKDSGGVYAWGALASGDKVLLYVDGRLWRGKVIQTIHDAGSQGIDGNTEYKCPTRKCGTLTTCAGVRPAYVVVRIAYQ